MASTFSERLYKLIQDSGKNQTEFSELVGINKGTISKYLKGEYEPKQTQIYKIANATGCDYAWLIGYEGPMQKEAPEAEPQRLTETQEELIEMVKGLDEDQAHKVQQLIALLLGQ